MSDADVSNPVTLSKRPPWIRWGLILFGIPTILVAVYLIDAWLIWSSSPVIAVDHLARLNDSIRDAQPADRAWPGIRDSVSRLRMVAPAWIEDEGTNPGFQRNRWLSQTISHSTGGALPGWREPAASTEDASVDPPIEFVEAVERERGGLLAAIERPVRGFELEHARDRSQADRLFFDETLPGPPSTSPLEEGIMFMGIPHMNTYRTAARLLDWDARRAALAGDGGRVLEDVRGMLLLGEGVRQPSLLITELVGTAIDLLAFDLVLDLMAIAPDVLDDVQMRSLESLLATLPADRFQISMDHERAFFDDTIQRIYSDDGEGDGLLLLRYASGVGVAGAAIKPTGTEVVASFLLGPVVGRFGLSRARATSIYHTTIDAWEAEASKPPHEVDRRVLEKAVGRPIEELEGLAYFPLATLVPLIGPVQNTGTSTRLHGELALMACRLELARRDGLTWQEGFDRLASAGEVVLDPFDGRPVRFEVIDGQPTIWSIGPDLDDDSAAPLQDGRMGAVEPRRLDPDATMREASRFWGLPPIAGAEKIDGDVVLWRGIASVSD